MDRRSLAGISLALVVAVTVVYAPVREHEFLNFDDDAYIVENAPLRQGLTLAGLRWAFTAEGDLYVPLTWISYLLDQEIHGLSAGGALVANAVYHALSATALLAALSVATGAVWCSAFVAAVFALHPLHVESVAWASERKDVLCGLFWNLTLLAYVLYARRPSVLRYAWVFLGTALAMGAKPMAVTLPFVLLLLDFWPLRRISSAAGATTLAWRARLLEKLPLLALSVAGAVLTYGFQEAHGAIRSQEAIPLATRLGNASLSYLSYLWQAVWPVDLVVFHPYREPSASSALGAGAVLLGASVGALLSARRHPYLPVGWFWYLGTLVPVIGLVQVGEQSMADRYTYVPLVGATLAVTWWADEIASHPRTRAALSALAGCAVLALAVTAHAQVAVWRNGVTLFEQALRVDPSNQTARGNLGIALVRRGDVDAGVRELATALGATGGPERKRRFVYAYLVARGRSSLREGKAQFAVPFFRTARQIEPALPAAPLWLSRALLSQQRFDEALETLRAATEIAPTAVMPAVDLAELLASCRNHGPCEPGEALRVAQRAVALSPDSAAPLGALAEASAANGRHQQALRVLERAVAIALDAGQSGLAARLLERRERYARHARAGSGAP